MPSAVKLSDEIVKDARREAKLMKRSIAGQVEYWANLGRTIESSGLFSVDQVRAVLNGEGTPTTGILRELKEAGHPIAGEDADGKLRVVRAAAPMTRADD